MNFVCNVARVFKLNAILRMIYLITSSLPSSHFLFHTKCLAVLPGGKLASDWHFIPSQKSKYEIFIVLSVIVITIRSRGFVPGNSTVK